MVIIKSFSAGNGDMFYIKHGSSNFTIIDCCLSDENKKEIVEEIITEKKYKDITRFISTHPDEDHIQMLDYLDDEIGIQNFYCGKNETTKSKETPGFKRYCELRDSSKAFYIQKGSSRKWMNQDGKDSKGKNIGSSGNNILWPDVSDKDYKEALEKAKNGESPNNISCIIKYSMKGGVTAIWMGDLEKDFMEKIKDKVSLPKVNILFAPHHGRKSGKIPQEWLEAMDPDVIIKGEANSKDSDYASYPDHNKIHQNRAKDIIMECEEGKIHFYVSNENYCVDFLKNENKSSFNYYIGSLDV
ncbi:hypothetical protein CLV24_12164 [Pontibacter ummariensis]|uniref:Metal-dependent hydrolase, beta-lactamase superfamily II n=1 Tax=Pontibacter ummariensis TaxID=1610492 RepID=A0A239JF94_9BACT|nr:hypothetical protein [Pontibacter ummariensis]PRY08377.1 hypothetical protein CLV24_12164 [Pontibacter ummariensis]SNT03963.1 hypothetical protein SAMN06296052_12164 [Pontibacter ummariensis]